MNNESASHRYSYRYYVLGKTNPVRVVFNKACLRIGAEALDLKTGELTVRTSLLSSIDTSPDAEEITRVEFDRLCSKALSRN